MKILVLDCKLYSLAYWLIRLPDEEVLADGMIKSIGKSGAVLTHRQGHDGKTRRTVMEILDHEDAVRAIVAELAPRPSSPSAGLAREAGERGDADQQPVIANASEIDGVGHRVVHGGERFTESCQVNERVLADIGTLSELAPLHNPSNVKGIEGARAVLPRVPHVAVFDTAIYSTMPERAYVYGLPYEMYERYKIRRYGFHGISHQNAAAMAAKFLGRRLSRLRLISCHLGSGCSVSACDRGRWVDTSMGFTPLEGLVMETRCGDIDPGAISQIVGWYECTPTELCNLLNRFSGLLGICETCRGIRGISGMQEVLAEMARGNDQARLAVDVFCYRVRKYIAAYAGVLAGLDAIVFTAGIGLNAPLIRAKCLENLGFLGLKLDRKLNRKVVGETGFIHAEDSDVAVVVVPDHEELAIARETAAVLRRRRRALREKHP